MMKTTKTGEQGIKLIKSFESCVLHPYKDAVGIPTIGWGNTFYENGIKVTINDPSITQERADQLFLYVLDNFEKHVDSFCRDDINQNQFDALVSFAYNCGTENLRKSTLLKKINLNPSDSTIREEFMKWDLSNGIHLPGLTRRRGAEANLYFSK